MYQREKAKTGENLKVTYERHYICLPHVQNKVGFFGKFLKNNICDEKSKLVFG